MRLVSNGDLIHWHQYIASDVTWISRWHLPSCRSVLVNIMLSLFLTPHFCNSTSFALHAIRGRIIHVKPKTTIIRTKIKRSHWRDSSNSSNIIVIHWPPTSNTTPDSIICHPCFAACQGTPISRTSFKRDNRKLNIVKWRHRQEKYTR